MASTVLPGFLARASAYAERVAVVDDDGTWSYSHLLHRSGALAAVLLDGAADLSAARVVLLAGPSVDFVAALWAIWRAGGIAVPVSPQQPPAEWAYVCDDSIAEAAIVAPELASAFEDVAAARGIRVISISAGAGLPAASPELDRARPALMLYTSGTTSRPKGVVLTHANIEAQVTCLVDAWGWSADDWILSVLPLNHVHGLINVVACALWCGAVCEMPRAFDATSAWNRLCSGGVTVFMAVPTIYHRLIAAWQAASADVQGAWSAGSRRLRLMVSGSAALPVGVLETWRQMTGHTLLERYGMTEIGMALSNPLAGIRRPGFVGSPLPGVEVRLLDDRGEDVSPGRQGEIHVRGAGVFSEYWGRSGATAGAFRDGGWFRTGDVAVVDDGSYRILGRLSVDIIKTGGEKVSALEIEEVLREHPDVVDCAVVGLPDPEWGECVGAAVVTANGVALELPGLRAWARERLASPKVPRRIVAVAELPRNAMGKVSKALVIQLFEGPWSQAGA